MCTFKCVFVSDSENLLTGSQTVAENDLESTFELHKNIRVW